MIQKFRLVQKKSKLAKGKIDFNRQIGLYPERQSKTEYNKTIRHVRLFFQGKTFAAQRVKTR